MARHPVLPEAFEDQLQFLHDNDYYTVSLEEWRIAMETHKSLPGRAIIMTFDGGSLHFLNHAWPRLRHFGFSANVLITTNAIGRQDTWDPYYGDEFPMLGWKEIRDLKRDGIEFGSLSHSYTPLTALSFAEVVREGARSRAILQRELKTSITCFAYPYGDEDLIVQHLIGACGYIFGLSCRGGPASLSDSLLSLPRIEIRGSDSLEDFVNKLYS